MTDTLDVPDAQTPERGLRAGVLGLFGLFAYERGLDIRAG